METLRNLPKSRSCVPTHAFVAPGTQILRFPIAPHPRAHTAASPPGASILLLYAVFSQLGPQNTSIVAAMRSVFATWPSTYLIFCCHAQCFRNFGLKTACQGPERLARPPELLARATDLLAQASNSLAKASCLLAKASELPQKRLDCKPSGQQTGKRLQFQAFCV